jgi:hypothetical protein
MSTQKLIVFVCALLYKPLCAQDLEAEAKGIVNAVKENPLVVSGNISATTLSYRATGIAPRRDPFYYVLGANLTITVLNKISIPFSAIFTQANRSFSNGLERYAQPFTQFGCSPTYKWLTVHIGYRSLSYSDYSLNGLLFLGGGVEIKPKKSIFSGMASFGRFVHNAGESDQISTSIYERWGGAVKVKAEKNSRLIEAVYMHLNDRASNNTSLIAGSELPKQNAVVGLKAATQIAKKIKFEGDYAFSMYSENTLLPALAIDDYTYINQIFNNRASSRYSGAGSLGVNYDESKYGLGINYKRIAPDYYSLGSPFITNDIEEISGSFRTGLLKQKLQMQSALGQQKNNLDGSQNLQNKRLIGSLSINAAISSQLNFQTSYSNFSSNSKLMRDLYSDSLRISQVNESGNAQLNYAISNKQLSQNYSVGMQIQNAQTNGLINNYIAHQLNMQFSLTKIGLQISLSANHGETKSPSTDPVQQLSGSLQIQKSWKNGKIKCALSSQVQSQLQTQTELSKTFNQSLDGSYALKSGLSCGLQAQFLFRKGIATAVSSFSEQRISLFCKQAFNYKMKKKTPK